MILKPSRQTPATSAEKELHHGTLHRQRPRFFSANGLYKASAFEAGQEEKYGADFIITDTTQVYEVKPDGTKVKTTLKAAELAVANDAWKGKGTTVLEDLEASKKAYRNGNKRKNKNGEVYEGYEGNWYITAKNKTCPTCWTPSASR